MNGEKRMDLRDIVKIRIAWTWSGESEESRMSSQLMVVNLSVWKNESVFKSNKVSVKES